MGGGGGYREIEADTTTRRNKIKPVFIQWCMNKYVIGILSSYLCPVSRTE